MSVRIGVIIAYLMAVSQKDSPCANGLLNAFLSYGSRIAIHS